MNAAPRYAVALMRAAARLPVPNDGYPTVAFVVEHTDLAGRAIVELAANLARAEAHAALMHRSSTRLFVRHEAGCVLVIAAARSSHVCLCATPRIDIVQPLTERAV